MPPDAGDQEESVSESKNTEMRTAQDEQEIKALVDRLFDSWGRGDAAAYVADFADDMDYVSYDGSRRGRAESEEEHRDLFRTVLYGSRLVGEVETLRFVTPDVAVAHLTGSIIEGWRETPLKRRLSRQTMVAVRRDGRWMVTAFHNTRLRPVPTTGPVVELAGRFIRWRTDRARRKASSVRRPRHGVLGTASQVEPGTTGGSAVLHPALAR
jgi:uncharacterized protein (TIGR02246 family)